MKKSFILSALSALIFCSTFIIAQQNMTDVVYLKNGNVIHGTIIENTINESIKIKTTGNDVLTFKYDEIQKFAKEQPASSMVTSAVIIDSTLYKDDFSLSSGISIPGGDLNGYNAGPVLSFNSTYRYYGFPWAIHYIVSYSYYSGEYNYSYSLFGQTYNVKTDLSMGTSWILVGPKYEYRTSPEFMWTGSVLVGTYLAWPKGGDMSSAFGYGFNFGAKYNHFVANYSVTSAPKNGYNSAFINLTVGYTF